MSVDYKCRQIYNDVIHDVTKTKVFFHFVAGYTVMSLIMFSWSMHRDRSPLS